MKHPKELVIVDIPSPGVLGGVFSDLIVALIHSLDKLGYRVVYERTLVRTSLPVIVFGFYRNFIKSSPIVKWPDNYFNFNLAPIVIDGVTWFDNYVNCIAQGNVIDYSMHNANCLSRVRIGSGRTHIFDFGYFDLMPFKGFERSKEFLFYGKLNEERIERLNRLKDAGLKIDIIQNSWGFERDIKIRTAKAVINIGKYNPNLLEVYRIWHSLCLGTPVYSDAGIDTNLVEKYSKYANISNRVAVDSFQASPISADIYKENTNFLDSTIALLDFIHR